MNTSIMKRTGLLSLFCIVMTLITLQSPLATCYADEYPLDVDFSPNIINIKSERVGEIRLFTRMSYSFFIANAGTAFIYVNDSESIENIRATRDCWGNLILKFDLEDLLALGGSLIPDSDNDVTVAITINNGDEYIGQTEVYLTDKKAP